MRSLASVVIAAFLVLVSPLDAAAQQAPALSHEQVIQLTRQLEDKPLSKDAELQRALLLLWEAESKDVEDVVCSYLSPLMEKKVKYGTELMFQHVFGSASAQLLDPSIKGQMQPSQLAGMTSMLKAYRNILVDKPKARVAVLDEWLAWEASGEMQARLEPIVATCKVDK